MNNHSTKIMPLMKCGHVSQTIINGEPYCIVCDNYEIANEIVDLENRQAKCRYCNRHVKSNFTLPHFRYCTGQSYDEYYCGCIGWD